MSVCKYVDNLILEKISGALNEKIYLTFKDFQEFIKEVEPIYRKRYGGFICDTKAAEEGYDNLLYHGVVVCCQKGGK